MSTLDCVSIPDVQGDENNELCRLCSNDHYLCLSTAEWVQFRDNRKALQHISIYREELRISELKIKSLTNQVKRNVFSDILTKSKITEPEKTPNPERLYIQKILKKLELSQHDGNNKLWNPTFNLEEIPACLKRKTSSGLLKKKKITIKSQVEVKTAK